MPKWFNKWTSILLNLNLAGITGVLALFHDAGWVRDWLWFDTGLLAGFALFWLFHERFAERSRRQMREEMNQIGAEYVQKMHEAIGLQQYRNFAILLQASSANGDRRARTAEDALELPDHGAVDGDGDGP